MLSCSIPWGGCVLSIQNVYLLVCGMASCILRNLFWLKFLDNFLLFQALSRARNYSCCTLNLLLLQVWPCSALVFSCFSKFDFPQKLLTEMMETSSKQPCSKYLNDTYLKSIMLSNSFKGVSIQPQQKWIVCVIFQFLCVIFGWGKLVDFGWVLSRKVLLFSWKCLVIH